MNVAAKVVIALVALLHVYFLVLEMLLWQTDLGLKTFGMTAEQAANSAVLAANQGLYNGFLAAGLLTALWLKQRDVKHAFTLFFLVCVIIAGIYGGLTAKTSIIFIQAMPAALALLLYLGAQRSPDA